MEYAPNNNEKSKLLYTGRTNDISQLFNFVKNDTCVALFGERKSGKTLTLKMIKEIINGYIIQYQNRLIDKKFSSAIASWRESFKLAKSIYISLLSLRSEKELLKMFKRELQELGIIKNEYLIELSQANQLNGLLDIRLYPK